MCAVCGAPTPIFASSGRHRKYCSEGCRRSASYAGRSRLRCTECGCKTGWFAGRADEAMCRPCRAQAMRAASLRLALCAYCGCEFESVRLAAGRGGWTEHCSKSCARSREYSDGKLPQIKLRQEPVVCGNADAESAADAAERRRLRMRSVAREPYSLSLIAERDRSSCGICGGVVDMGLRHPDRLSPSIDHVVPIARGGDDTVANVQLAHLICNIRKRDDLPVRR